MIYLTEEQWLDLVELLEKAYNINPALDLAIDNWFDAFETKEIEFTLDESEDEDE